MTEAEFAQFVTRTLMKQIKAMHPRSVRKIGQSYEDLLALATLRSAARELVLELTPLVEKKPMTPGEVYNLTISRCRRKALEVWDLYLSDPDNPNQVITRTE